MLIYDCYENIDKYNYIAHIDYSCSGKRHNSERLEDLRCVTNRAPVLVDCPEKL